MSLITNVSPTGFTGIENQVFLLFCPFPINGGIGNNTNIVGLTVTYELVPDTTGGDYHLHVFHCKIDPITGNRGVDFTTYEVASNWFSIGQNYLAYLMQVIFSVFQKLQAVFSILSFIISPANFSIVGYTLADIGGVGLAFVILVYAMCYVFIGIWLYVTFMPFKGGN